MMGVDVKAKQEDSTLVIVISLATAVERRNNIIKQLECASANYIVTDAVDGRELKELPKDVYDSELATHFCGRPLTQNEIGCAMSHTNAWEYIVANNLKHALIVEDDALFDSKLWTFLQCIDDLPDGWGVINFRSDSTDFEVMEEVVHGVTLKRFTNTPNGAVAYLVSASAAKVMMKYAYPIKKASDGTLAVLTRMKKIKNYGTEPQLVSIDDDMFPSLIGDR